MSRIPEVEAVDHSEYLMDHVPVSTLPGEKMSPTKARTMKDYENQITDLKKENFNLKLRIYFMEERMQQKFDDSSEDIYKTNIELKVEVESLKRDLQEKQALLVTASKAVESLAGNGSGEIRRVKELAVKEVEQLKDFFGKKIERLEEELKAAQDEVEKMAAIAEQEKVRNMDMEKRLLAFSISAPFGSLPSQDMQKRLEEKERVIEQLSISLQNKDAVIEQLQSNRTPLQDSCDTSAVEKMENDLSAALRKKDEELEALRNELGKGKVRLEKEMESFVERQNEVAKLLEVTQQLTEELSGARGIIHSQKKRLEEVDEETKALSGRLEEQENNLASERKNTLKRDKTIQGLSLALKEKDKEIEELYHQIEDRDEALAKAREAARKAQMQKYQGVEEHQNLLTEKEAELVELLAEHHAKVAENQKLQRALGRREQELSDLQQAKEQLEGELEDLQQQKNKGDKAINDLQNQLKKLKGEVAEKERALDQQYQALLSESKQKAQSLELTIKRLTSSLSEKDQLLQEYMNMTKDSDEDRSRSPDGRDAMLAKLRERLKEKEKALEEAIDEKFAAIDEKDNEVRQLHLSLREKERDLERLSNLLSHNEETINSLDSIIKEKDGELQHLANTLKNHQRVKQELEENWARALREKDAIISQLQQSLASKTKDLEEMAETLLSQTRSNARDLAEQLTQRLKVTEAMLAEAIKDKERLVSENKNVVEELLATIGSKDQLFKESAEHYNRSLSERNLEIQELRRQLSEEKHKLSNAEKQSSAVTQETYLEMAELKVQLTEKDTIINKLVESGQERDKFLAQLKLKETSGPQVLELKQTIEVLQERLEETEAELAKTNEGSTGKIPVIKKTAVALKKELAQKTETLNKALKKENDLRIELAELRSTLTDLENRIEAQAAHIESLTTTLEVKDEIILDLHERLGKQMEGKVLEPEAQRADPREGRQIPGIPQRERTIIGGNSQQEAFPTLQAVLSEHEELNKALKAEQQLYSSLVRSVKEPDSAQRLHNLQMELAAVQLLRQQLEEGIRGNEELREDLEKELHQAKRGEGTEGPAILVDPKEMEAMRHQLEDAQRWNASLQARLGEIQGRGGGVGGTNDTADTISFIGDQTSYMSICVGEGEEFDNLSMPELRRKVSELFNYIKELQAINAELQKRTSLAENPAMASTEKGKQDILTLSSENKQLEKKLEEAVKTNKDLHDQLNRESQRAAQKKGKCQLRHQSVQVSPEKEESFPVDNRTEQEGCSGKCENSETAAHSTVNGSEKSELVLEGSNALESISQTQANGNTDNLVSDGKQQDQEREMALLRSLLRESRTSSVLQLRDELLGLRAENANLRGLLKEEKSAESKESSDGAGDGESIKDLQKVIERLRAEVKSSRKIIKLLKEQLELNSSMDGETSFNPELIVSMAREIERLKTEYEASKKRAEDLETTLAELEAQQQKASEQNENHSGLTNMSAGTFPNQSTIRQARHAASGSMIGSKSRLPVPIKPSKSTVNSKITHPQMDSSLLEEKSQVCKQTDQHPITSDSPRSTPADQNADRTTEKQDEDLLQQIAKLQDELQEKKQLITELEQKLQSAKPTTLTSPGIHGNLREVAQLQNVLREKDKLNKDLEEKLHQAEETILSLNTYMSNDVPVGNHNTDVKLHHLIYELQTALQEKDQLNKQLKECLHAAESTITSLTATDSEGKARDVEFHQQLEELQKALQVKEQQLQQYLCSPDSNVASHTETSLGDKSRDKGMPDAKLHKQVEELQLHDKELLNKSLEEPLCTVESTIVTFTTTNLDDRAKEIGVPDAQLQQQVVRLQEMLQEKNKQYEQLQENMHLLASSSSSATHQNDSEDLHKRISDLQKTIWEKDQANSELQERLCAMELAFGQWNADRTIAGENLGTDLHTQVGHLQNALEEQKQLNKELKEQWSAAESNMVPSDKHASVQRQADKLQKTLKEQLQAQKALEEKLKTAETTISRLRTKSKARGASHHAGSSLEQDDKEIQVDLQDFGYETSGKSENEVDREENGSPDHDNQLKQHASESSIPSLVKQIHGNFFSMENLETNSTTSYPSSPTLSSPKASMKSLHIYDDYGLTDDAEQLRQQVMELKVQLENYQKVVHHLQSLLRRNSLSSDLLTVGSDSHHTITRELQEAQDGDHEELQKDSQQLSSGVFSRENSQNQSLPLSQDEEEKQMLKDQITNLNIELDKEKMFNKNLADQLQQIQLRTRAASPGRFDSLVQSQARELSHLRQQIKESRSLGALQRHQLQDLGKAFEELLQASEVDYYVGEVFREQLDKSLTVLEKLEDRLENGDAYGDNEEGALLELAQRQSLSLLLASPDSLQREITYLQKQLKSERQELQKQLKVLARQNQNLADATKEQLDLLTREVQDKNLTIQRLQQQIRSQSLELSSSHPSSDSDASDRISPRTRNSRERLRPEHKCSQTSKESFGPPDRVQKVFSPRASNTDISAEIKVPNGVHTEEATYPPSGLVRKSSVAGDDVGKQSFSQPVLNPEEPEIQTDSALAQSKHLQELQRENILLLDKLKSSEQLNDTLRSELDLHRSILADREEAGREKELSPTALDKTATSHLEKESQPEGRNEAPGLMNADLLAEHLQEIRSLRRRLEESIKTNDRLREQLERKLAEVERDPASTNIFIHGTEEQGQLEKEIRFLWGQNQALKEQLNLGSRDKQKENEKLRESLAKRNAKLEYLRNEYELMQKDNSSLRSRLGHTVEENNRFKDTLLLNRDKINGLQCEVNALQQQLADSQHLLKSLHVELQVYEQLKADRDKNTVSDAAVGQTPDTPVHSPGSLDLSELLSEIRHLRIQLERSIQTNNALRQKLEEQLLRGPSKAEGSPSTININYLLSGEHRHSTLSNSGDNAAKSPTNDNCEHFPHPSFHGSAKSGRTPTGKDVSNVLQEINKRMKSDLDCASQCSSSSADSASPTPSRLVPGHRLWANKNGRHVLGLIEDYNALRKQISEGKMLTHGMDKHLQECFHALSQQASESKVLDQRFLKGFSTNVNTMQQILEEASRLLKLLWRISLPTNTPVNSSQSHQGEMLKNEITRLRCKLSQQERLLTGTVKRLHTTNQLKEGMEKVIISQLSLTHGVLKKARGNLEIHPMEEVPVHGN
ncbi:CDK5 regulatory subunit-associated protein 2 isoform X2 [Lepisosteus oculatus]